MTDRAALRVALLTTAFPRWENDSRGPWVLETARALRDLGVQVRVLTVHGPGSRGHEVLDEIHVHRVRYLWPDRLEALQDVGGGLPAAWKAGWPYRLAFIPFFMGLVRAAVQYGRDADVVHAHWTLAGLAAWLASWVTGTPFVLTVHGSDIYIAPGIPGVAALTRGMLRGCAHVVAVSRDLAEATRSLGCPPERLEVLGNGVELERFTLGAAEREPLLVFVGALIRRKAVDVLLDALPAVLSACPGARLVVVGEGPEREALERQALQLGLTGSVTFVGAQSRAETAAWMRRARIFVLPSREEAFGVVLLEALASGTPCVASRVGGVVDIVAPDVGVLVPPGDAAALAGAVSGLLQDSSRWVAMSARAREHVVEQGRTWPRVAHRLAEIYRSVAR